MTDLLITGSNAVKNTQLALNVVSNNIANVNTEGYVKQSLVYSESPSTVFGSFFIGNGSLADGVKRAYDGLLENSVRMSESDFSSQSTLLDLTNRLIDLFGDQDASLVPALAGFFDSTSALALDASSLIRREEFLSSASNMANRFNELSARLQDVSLETSEALGAKMEKFNQLNQQLAGINEKLLRVQELQKQPPELLDLRDTLLRDIAKLAKVSIIEEKNGSVALKLGDTDFDLVSGTKFGVLDFASSDNKKNGYEFNLRFDGAQKKVSTVRGGELGGTTAFYANVLLPTTQNFESLATTFVSQVNLQHRKGVDLFGDRGTQVFSTSPAVVVGLPDGSGRLQVQESFGSNEVVEGSYKVTYVPETGAWVTSDSEGVRVVSSGSPSKLILPGVSLEIDGIGQAGDVISIDIEGRAASTMHMTLDDARRVAAADPFQIKESPDNVGSAAASVKVSADAGLVGVPKISDVIANNGSLSGGRSFQADLQSPAFFLPKGATDIKLLARSIGTDIANLQILTRDGQHLFGSGMDAEKQEGVLNNTNAFSVGAIYRSDFLNDGATEVRIKISELSSLNGSLTINGTEISPATPVPSARQLVGLINAQSEVTNVVAGLDGQELVVTNVNGKNADTISFGDDKGILGDLTGDYTPEGFKKNDWRAGTFSKSVFGPTNDNGDAGRLLSRALIQSDGVNPVLNETAEDLVVLEEGALRLNGYSLNALVLSPGQVLTADLANDWLTENIERLGLPLLTSLENSISITENDLENFNFSNFQINGVLVTEAQAPENLVEFKDLINLNTDRTGVDAYLDYDGSLVVRNTGDQNQALPIRFGPVGVGDAAFKDFMGLKTAGVKIEIDPSLNGEDASGDEIALSVGKLGKISDLKMLGFAAQIEFSGTLNEDLVVFIDGPPLSSLIVGAAYQASSTDKAGLIEHPFEIEFTAKDRYILKDTATNTIVAERAYTEGEDISYREFNVSLDGIPAVGDRFVVRANSSGAGDSGNVASLAALESLEVIAGEENFQQNYLSILGNVGTISNQADVAMQAMEVVRDQAIERRSGLSGVNLDEEAANLVRFQQAYQASARLIQTATELFQTIIRL